MNKLVRTSLLTCLMLSSSLSSSALLGAERILPIKTSPTQNHSIAQSPLKKTTFTQPPLTQASIRQDQLTKSSILQTQIVPYLQSENTETQYQSSQEQLAVVEQELATTQDELAQAESEIQSLIDHCSISACESILESTQDLLSDTDQLLQTTESVLESTRDVLSDTDQLLFTTESRLDATLIELSDCDSVLESTQDELIITQELLSQTDSILESTVDVLDTTRAEFSACESVLESTQDELIITQELLSQTDSILESTSDVLDITRTEFSACESVLESTQDELFGADSQIDVAELLLSGTAIPDASEIDATIASLFSLTPCTTECASYNPNDPLIEQINNGLIPYLQNTLTNIGEFGRIAQIAAGYSHTVVLTTNGSVYATGRNFYGQLGTENNDDQNTLTAMVGEGTSGCTAIAAGFYHTVVLKDTGAAYATGLNDRGQLGTGDTLNTNTLTAMLNPGDTGVTAIAGGGNHTVILKDNSAYTVGYNYSGQLGIGISGVYGDFRSTLTEMINDDGYNADIAAITAGENHTVVLNASGYVYGAGDNSSSQLSTINDLGVEAKLEPMVLDSSSLPITDISYISAGANHTVLLNISSGTAYATGYNDYGQLGINGSTEAKLTPMVDPGNLNVTAIAAGGAHTVALKGAIAYATGYNSSGQLGTGDTVDVYKLTPMVGEGTSDVTNITAGYSHTVALKNTDITYGTGSNGSGQLGTGNTSDQTTLSAVSASGAAIILYY